MAHRQQDHQPDVYETPDATAVAAQEETEVVAGEDSLNVRAAFEKFFHTGKISTVSAVSTKKQRGYRSGGVGVVDKEFEILAVGEQETPSQRLHRLQYEVAELLEQVEKAKKEEEEKKADDLNKKASLPSRLLQQVLVLQSHLSSVGNLDGVQLSQTDSGTVSDATGRLISHLSEFRHTAASEERESGPTRLDTAPSSQGQSVVYELFYSKDVIKSNEVSQVASLEARLSNIEKLVGFPANFEANREGGLVSALESVEEQVNQLGNKKLDQVSRRVKALLPELEKAVEKKSAIGGDVEAKVHRLFEKLDSIDALSGAAPLIADRLRTLRRVHQEGATLVDTVRRVQEEQNKIKEMLATSKESLEKVQALISENSATIKENVQNLEKRMADLAARVA